MQHRPRIQRGDRHPGVGRDPALGQQRFVAKRADPQEGREIADLAARGDQLVVELLDQLHHPHAVAPGDLLEHLPEQVLEPDAGDHAMQADRAGAAVVALRVGADEHFAHGHLLVVGNAYRMGL